MANPEDGPEPYHDPTTDIIYEIIHTLRAEQLGNVAMGVETMSGDSLEESPPLLPSTPNDVKWETWHNGSIDIVAGPEAGRGEVLKIYRSATVRPNITLTTPSGNTVRIGGHDIVQVYERDEAGTLRQQASHIFQGTINPPKGFAADTDRNDRQQAELRRIAAALREEAKNNPGPKPAFGRKTPERWLLYELTSAYFSVGRGQQHLEVPGDNPHEVLIIYPFVGTSMHVVTPNGFLLSGRSLDRIEVVVAGPDGGYTTQRALTLQKLAQEEKYMTL
jgi:hypothetical protein